MCTLSVAVYCDCLWGTVYNGYPSEVLYHHLHETARVRKRKHQHTSQWMKLSLLEYRQHTTLQGVQLLVFLFNLLFLATLPSPKISWVCPIFTLSWHWSLLLFYPARFFHGFGNFSYTFLLCLHPSSWLWITSSPHNSKGLYTSSCFRIDNGDAIRRASYHPNISKTWD